MIFWGKKTFMPNNIYLSIYDFIYSFRLKHLKPVFYFGHHDKSVLLNVLMGGSI